MRLFSNTDTPKMGLIKKTFVVGMAGSAAGLAYLGATNKIITPIPASDPLWTSSIYAKHNPSRNPATQDVCVKRIPLSKIRPELIDKPESLVLEYCRGVWSGLGESPFPLFALLTPTI